MKNRLCVLQVEDSASDAALIVRLLGNAGYAVDAERVETESELYNCPPNGTNRDTMCRRVIGGCTCG